MGLGFATAAAANEWYVNGVLVSNVCTGSATGTVWIYPVYAAQPVGTTCRVFSTGEFGIVG